MNAKILSTLDRSDHHANVDPLERHRFEQMASQWWDAGGAFWPIHGLNALRADYIARTVPRVMHRHRQGDQPLAGLAAVDVGCGGGILAESLARMGASVHGVDVVGRNIDIALHHARGRGLDVHYESADADTLVRRGLTFDLVTCMEVVEHVPDVEALINDCIALLRPGGVFVVATINRTMFAWLTAIAGAEYVLKLLPRGTHQWRRFVRPSELTKPMERAGLAVCETAGVRVNPFTRKFWLSRNMSVNYMLVAKRRL
jgi:2-polyprenyl-6-hydroxyphenyl methylase/3-demethylubiquinone-9 3-methyltransferase